MDSEISENVGEANDNSTDAEYVPEEEVLEEQETSEKKRRPKFTIWKYFKRLSPASQKRARCRICLEVKSYRTSSTNLKSHLKFRHPKIMEQCLEPTRDETSAEVGTTETDIDNPVPPCKPRWRDPTIWKYFKRGPPNSEKIAQCNYCQQLRSYKTSITNLKTHLSLKHPEVVEQDQQLVRRILSGSNLSEMLVSDDRNSNHKPNENDNDSDLSETMEGHDEETNAEKEQDENNAQQVKRVRPASDRGYSNIWNYFKKLEPFQEKLASCKYCHKIRSYRSSITNLKTHLVLKHPEDIQHDGYFTDKNYLADDSESEKNTKPNRKSPKVPKKIVISKLFEIDDNRNVARCKLCSQDIHFTTTDTLKHHILKLHGKDITQGSLTVDEEEFNLDDTSDADKQRHLEDDSETLNTKKYERRSKNWDYFELVDEVNKIARCNACGNDLSYSTISNLRKHLNRKHSSLGAIPEFASSPSPQKAQLKRKNFVPENFKRQHKFRSKVWKYFEIIDEPAKLANCGLCNNNFNYTCLSNLKKHLRKKHEGELTSSEEEGEVEILEEKHFVPKNLNRQHRFRSRVWKYFEIIDESAKLANCRLCNNNFNYTGLSNLRKHLRRKHEGELTSSEEEGEVEILEEQNSTVWAYFKCLSEDLKIASCLICKKRVDYNDDDDLSKHLNRKHPQVQAELNSATSKPKKLMITGNGDIYEIDEDVAKQEPITVQEVNDNDSDGWPYNNDETDALDTSEYLEENIFNEHKSVPAKKSRLSYQKTSDRHENIRTQITNQNQKTSQPCDEESSLDIFGKYMVSLLKKLPKHKSDQLQADFVKQIMDAQNDSENTRGRHTRSITVQNTHTRNTRTSIDDKRVTSNSEEDRVVHSKFPRQSPPPLVAIEK